ncbi:efflux RND transporter periplasmic adaptor subunit [bacterium]|nr:efflux RND transporter periplasmic adaptor subunit [bacterium]
MRKIRTIFKVALPIAIIVFGIQFTLMLIDQKQPPKTAGKVSKEKVKLVRVEQFKPKGHQVIVKAQATTKPVMELSIASQAKGEAIWISPALVEGGWVKKGQLLFRINPIDYQLLVNQAEAGLAKSKYELDLIAAKKQAADSGIEIYQKMRNNKDTLGAERDISGLARYEPQIANAKAVLKSSEANLKQAQLDLSRTKIYAPFSGYIRSVTLAVGQIVSAGQTVASMFKDKPIILNVSLPASELRWISVQQYQQDKIGEGSIALVSKQIGGITHQWEGVVKRQLQEIDALGRLITIVVEVDQPVSNHQFAMPMGMLVDVAIQGKSVKNVYGIPSESLRKDSTVWVISENNRLEIRPVTVIRKNEDEVFVSEGIGDKDKIVLTHIPSAVQGMKLAEAENQRPIKGFAVRKDEEDTSPNRGSAQ